MSAFVNNSPLSLFEGIGLTESFKTEGVIDGEELAFVDTVNKIRERCKKIFVDKSSDYGPTWMVFRFSSLIDQLYIKALRIRSLEEKDEDYGLVGEGKDSEFIGLINYAIMGIITVLYHDQLPNTRDLLEDFDKNSKDLIPKLTEMYDQVFDSCITLMKKKNRDYDSAWKKMKVSSMTDQIIIYILRSKNLTKNNFETLISEGIDAQMRDIINYSIFALIKLCYPEG